MVIWIIGMAGAGKTSVGRALHQLIANTNRATVLLDGDAIREIMGSDLGYSLEDRRRNGWRICRLCRYLDAQDINVVCATLSQFHEQQKWNRENFSRYFEVFLDVPMDVLIARDQKGLYNGALSGKVKDVVGIDMPFPPPASPDLVISNATPMKNLLPFAEKILMRAKERFPDWQ